MIYLILIWSLDHRFLAKLNCVSHVSSSYVLSNYYLQRTTCRINHTYKVFHQYSWVDVSSYYSYCDWSTYSRHWFGNISSPFGVLYIGCFYLYLNNYFKTCLIFIQLFGYYTFLNLFSITILYWLYLHFKTLLLMYDFLNF